MRSKPESFISKSGSISSHTFISDSFSTSSRGFGKENGLSIYAPVIVKYRDEKTDASTKLEDYLR
jgi:hypothetical protein